MGLNTGEKIMWLCVCERERLRTVVFY